MTVKELSQILIASKYMVTDCSTGEILLEECSSDEMVYKFGDRETRFVYSRGKSYLEVELQ